MNYVPIPALKQWNLSSLSCKITAENWCAIWGGQNYVPLILPYERKQWLRIRSLSSVKKRELFIIYLLIFSALSKAITCRYIQLQKFVTICRSRRRSLFWNFLFTLSWQRPNIFANVEIRKKKTDSSHVLVKKWNIGFAWSPPKYLIWQYQEPLKPFLPDLWLQESRVRPLSLVSLYPEGQGGLVLLS